MLASGISGLPSALSLAFSSLTRLRTADMPWSASSGNGALLFGHSCKYLLSASFAGTKTLRLGPLRNLGWSFEMGTLRALGAFALVAIAATVAFGLVAVAATWGSAVAATATVATAWPVAVAATTAPVAVAIPASALGASFDHRLKRLVVRNEFEQIGAGSLLAALHD